MSKEILLTKQCGAGVYYKVNVYEYPLNWEETAFGRFKLKLAYRFPNIVKKVTSGASMSLDKKHAQEELPSVVSYSGKSSANHGRFGKVVQDKGLC